jgi:hypothetical protein
MIMALNVTITPQMWLLISLLIDNALRLALDTVGKMTPEEIATGIAVEEEKKKANMAELDSH